MIEGVFSQSGSSTIGLDTDSVVSEGRPDGWNRVVSTSGLNLTFLRGLALGLNVPLEYPKLSSSKSTVVGSGVDGDVGVVRSTTSI